MFAVTATAGTTNAGIVDDLAGVAAECRKRDVWLHVDGAYGGAGSGGAERRAPLRGIEDADSFIVDPHKWLFAPYDACAAALSPTRAGPGRAQADGELSRHRRPGRAEPRRHGDPPVAAARGLSLWFSLATHGTERYRQAVEQCLTTARIVAEDIRSRPSLRLLSGPELSVLLFDRPGWTAEQLAAWSHEQAISGQVLCIPTRWRDEPVLRMIFVNPGTDPAVVGKVLDTLAR